MENDTKKMGIMRKILITWIEFTLEAENLQNHQLQVGKVAGLVDPAMRFCAPYLERQGRLQKRHPCHNEQSVKRTWASLSIL